MILCVNVNAAVDKTVIVSPFRLNQIHRPQHVLMLPGGKGCNVARALKTLGDDPVMIGWVGGFAGQFIESRLRDEGIETVFVHTESESRTCLSILDPETGTMTEIYEKGEPIPPDKLTELIEVFRERVENCSAVALSGSLPAGVPADFYARLIEIARDAGVPAYLDTSGEALQLGLAAQPAVIKPNRREFAELVGKEPTTAKEYAAAVAEISTRFDTTVILSIGSEGALGGYQNLRYHVRPPQVRIVSAVGSGDCLLAGVIYAAVRGRDLRDALRCGVAAGTANAFRLGAGVFTEDDFNQVYEKVTFAS